MYALVELYSATSDEPRVPLDSLEEPSGLGDICANWEFIWRLSNQLGSAQVGCTCLRPASSANPDEQLAAATERSASIRLK